MSIYRGTYYSASSCTGSARPGAKALMAWYLGAYGSRGAANLGIYVCKRLGSGYSIHGHGRACDMGTKPYGGVDSAWGWTLANALRLNSHELGVQLIILGDRVWSCRYPDAGWRTYTGERHGHAHVELTPTAAASLTVERIERVIGGSNASPSLPTSRVPDPPLRENDSGPRVATLQGSLNEVLGLHLIEDGYFGPHTTAGVKLLQRTAGIEQDGIYGTDSANALRDLLEDDMPTADQIAHAVWTFKNERLTRFDAYEHLRNPEPVKAVLAAQATHTALLKQVLAGQSGLTEAQITAAVAEGVREATPPVEEIAAAVAAAVDHDLDVEAVTAALREFYGGALGAGE